jgi:HEAT repeat protein
MMGCSINIKLGFAKPTVLIKFLSSPYRETRWDAADFLYTYHDQELIMPVFNVLQNEPDGHVRKRLIWILETNKAWDELFSCLDSPEIDVRYHAADALMHCDETRFVEPLLKKMYETNNQDHIYRQILKHTVDKNSIGLLLEYLSGATPIMKKGLLEIIGSTKEDQVLDYLLPVLKDPNTEIREGAVLGLMHLGNLQAIESLRELLNDPSKDLRDTVEMALYNLEKVTLQT